MITDSFDPNSQPLLNPESLYGKGTHLGDVVLAPFSFDALQEALHRFPNKEVTRLASTNGPMPIYEIEVKGKRILLYMSPIGAASAATAMAEAAFRCLAKKFVFFGSCGVLRDDLCFGKVIVPSESYRDEGISYHYAPPSDYIEISNAKKVKSFLEGKGIPSVQGRVWTCDAIYMETIEKAKKRREDGCIVVEMETAGLEAVARHYGIDAHFMLFGGDVLKEQSWDQNNFGSESEKQEQLSLLEIALDLAVELAK